jgi:aminoglycoside phosphotransferase (APT) family kinase protein
MSSASADKIVIDSSLVSRLISAQFPQWADLPVRPVRFGGWDNRTFHLGEYMTVRLPSAASYALQVEKEQRWLPRLAPHLPLPIPAPLALGRPGEGYPWHWSVYRWHEGEIATHASIADMAAFATALAEFLATLQQIDAIGGPPPGEHNFFRGGPLAVYDHETRWALDALEGRIDTAAARAVWEEALSATWTGSLVWFHGDIASGNLLVEDGRLSAVIDFGTSGVGDPACDLSIAWTMFQDETSKDHGAASRKFSPITCASLERM